MKKISIGIASEVEVQIPNVVDLIDHHRGGTFHMQLQLEEFERQPELFYNLIWYAASNGITVTIDATFSDGFSNNSRRTSRSYADVLVQASYGRFEASTEQI